MPLRYLSLSTAGGGVEPHATPGRPCSCAGIITFAFLSETRRRHTYGPLRPVVPPVAEREGVNDSDGWFTLTENAVDVLRMGVAEARHARDTDRVIHHHRPLGKVYTVESLSPQPTRKKKKRLSGKKHNMLCVVGSGLRTDEPSLLGARPLVVAELALSSNSMNAPHAVHVRKLEEPPIVGVCECVALRYTQFNQEVSEPLR